MYTYKLTDETLTTKTAVIDRILSEEANTIIKSTIRGNQIWTIQIDSITTEKKIVLYSIKRIGKQFAYSRIEEKNNFLHTNCPRNYLTQTTPIDNSWREKVNNNF